MSTFAAACAEVGQFEEAARWQARGLLAPSLPRGEWDKGRDRQNLYEEGKPYREPALGQGPKGSAMAPPRE